MNLNKEIIKKILVAASIILLISIVGGLVTSVNYFKKNKVEIYDEKVIPQSFSNIDINSNDYKLEILPTNKSQAQVVLTGSNRKSKPTLTTKIDNNTLFVKIKDEKSFKLINWDLDFIQVKIQVYLPTKSYDTINTDAKNGSINISALTANIVNIESNNGYINLTDIKTKQLSAKADNGKITFNDITSTTSTFNVKNGTIEGNYLSGKLNVKANNGRIKIRLNKITDHINMSSNNGSVKLLFDNKPEKTTFIANSNNGTIKIPNSFQSTNGSLYTVTLNSHNGRIIVE